MVVNKKIIYHVVRLVLAIVFIYASVDKIMHPRDFAQAVFNYQVLPGEMINIAAIVLPWLELILGTCLLFNVWMYGASSLTAILLFIFMVAITFNFMRGLDVGCGCFSTRSEESMNTLTLIRDLVFLCLSVGLVGLVFRRPKSLNNTSGEVR